MEAEERLKQLDEERRNLRAQVKSQREQRLEDEAKMRIERDSKIEKIQEKLNLISKTIYSYNKLGKVDKDKCSILQTIKAIIDTEEKEVEDGNNTEDN